MECNPIIKICGIRDPDMAKKTVQAGANLIGIVFHPLSPRAVTLNQAILISEAVKKAGGSPVAIFVNHTAQEMSAICKAADIHIVQLHGEISRASHSQLSEKYQRIYVKNISEKGELTIEESLLSLDVHRDMILVDHEKPGQGNIINQSKLTYSLPFRWLLAGGLTSLNVLAMMDELKPNGVDVSSGVELSKGKKDIFLIQQFINKVRGYHDK